MAQGYAAAASLNQPVGPQSTLSGLLGDIAGQHHEIENRLTKLRDMLQMRNEPPVATAVCDPQPGLITHGMSIRNSGGRIMNLVSELEGLL